MQPFKFKVVGLLMLCFCGLSSKAQKTLSLIEVRERVLQNSELARKALLDIEIADEKIKTAEAKLLPSLEASGTGFGTTDHVGLALAPRYGAFGGFSVEQPLYMGGKIKAGVELEKISKSISQHSLTLTNDELLYRVEGFYWNVVAANQQIKVAKEYVRSLASLEAKIQNSFDLGLVDKTDLLEVQVAFNRAVYNVETAQNRLSIFKLNLSNLTDYGATDFEVEESFQNVDFVPDFESDIQAALAQRAELSMIDKMRRAKEVESTIIRSDYRPQVGMSLGLQALIAEDNSFPQDAASAAPPLSFDNNQVFGLGLVSISVPIFDWNQKKTRLKMNTLQREQVDLDRRETVKSINLQLVDALNKIEESALNLSLSEKSRSQATENLRILNDNFELGRITSEEVLEGEALLQQACLEVINANVAKQLSYTNYLRTIGKLSN